MQFFDLTDQSIRSLRISVLTDEIRSVTTGIGGGGGGSLVELPEKFSLTSLYGVLKVDVDYQFKKRNVFLSIRNKHL